MAATIDWMSDTIEGSDRLLEQIRLDLHVGNFVEALNGAQLLASVLDGESVACCDECGKPLTSDELDRYTAWCGDDAPVLDLRFVD